MGAGCSSGTSYMQFFHCIHNYVHQLKRKCPREIRLHNGISNVHPSILIGVLEMVVANTLVILKVLLSTWLQRNCSNCLCTTRVTATCQLCQLAYKAYQKENHFLYNATKHFVK